ncbi:MAG: carbohydrate kinase family protein [Alphaproteobacteria bacterium]|nr:carbohydrate kinase family protein [Alphaproteobacteria bacterium]MCB9975813.1 carbohydrate kinase family protein [Rhodospirillales bacterium]
MTDNAPHIVVIGATNMDRVRIHPDLDRVEDGKFRAGHSYSAVGGGGANVAIALKEIANTFNDPLEVTFFTKIGREHRDYPVRHEVLEKLDSVGVDVRDMVPNQDHRIDDNTVISFKGGRFVSLQEEFAKGKAATHPLEQDRPSADPCDPGMEQQIIEAVRDADLVVVTHHFPDMSEIAATAAQKAGVPVLMDYPVTNYEAAWKYQRTLESCEYILAPAEARLPDMIGGSYKNGNSLFSKLTGRFPNKFIAVSDGTEPVMTHHDGRKEQIPVTQYPVVDQLGTGDVRTAAFVYFMVKEEAPERALIQATGIASFSVQYPGRQWIEHLPDYMKAHRLPSGQSANDPENEGEQPFTSIA